MINMLDKNNWQLVVIPRVSNIVSNTKPCRLATWAELMTTRCVSLIPTYTNLIQYTFCGLQDNYEFSVL